MTRHLALILALALAPSIASACSPLWFSHAAGLPTTWNEAQMPLNGWIYSRVEGDDSAFEFLELAGPDGELVEWSWEATPFDDSLFRLRPAGGWQVGDYVFPSQDEEAQLALSVVDEEDTETPSFANVRWTGRDAHPPGFCSEGNAAGIAIEGGPSEIAVVYWTALVDGEVVDSGRWLQGARTIDLAPGIHARIDLEAFDLAGNGSEHTLEQTVSCAGCSGSMAGGASLTPAVLLLGLVGIRRRR